MRCISISVEGTRERETRDISRRMEVVVISFGLWPMFDVTCRPRVVPTRHGMFGSRTRQRALPFPPSIFRRFPFARIAIRAFENVTRETDAKPSAFVDAAESKFEVPNFFLLYVYKIDIENLN